MAVMPRVHLHRRLIALIAAYGLALQALLSAFGAVSPAMALDSIICAADGDLRGGGEGGPIPSRPGHESGCAICPLACGGAAPAAWSDAGIGLTFRVGVAIAPPRTAAPVGRVFFRSGLARAPPV
jgi:DUF2946 family protein